MIYFITLAVSGSEAERELQLTSSVFKWNCSSTNFQYKKENLGKFSQSLNLLVEIVGAVEY